MVWLAGFDRACFGSEGLDMARFCESVKAMRGVFRTGCAWFVMASQSGLGRARFGLRGMFRQGNPRPTGDNGFRRGSIPLVTQI